MNNIKKILFISEDFRYSIKRGSDRRIYSLLKYLLERYNVTWLACESYGAETKSNFFFWEKKNIFPIIADLPERTLIRRMKNRLLGFAFNYISPYSYATKMKFTSIVKTLEKISLDDYEVIFLCYLAHNSFLKDLKRIKISKNKIIIDTHDVQYERMKSLYKKNGSLDYILKIFRLFLIKFDEKKALLKADCLIALSHEDKKYFTQEIAHPNVLFCSTGFDVNLTLQMYVSKTILFYGAMSDMINIKAVVEFKNYIFPLILKKIPDVKLIILGSNPSIEVKRLSDKNTIITGFVEDTSSFLTESACLVCPLNAEYGQRIRIIEALVHGLPIVTYSSAIKGMEIDEMTGVFSEDDQTLFAERVTALLKISKTELLELKAKILFAAQQRFNLIETYKPIGNYINSITSK